MPRTTIKVLDLLNEINRMLRESTCTPDIRLGMAGVLEYVLHSTGNYAGYGSLTQEEVPKGQLPGIMRKDEYLTLRAGNLDPAVIVRGCNGNVFPDDSRRHYVVNRRLRHD